MASGATGLSYKPLSFEDVQRLGAALAPTKVLPTLCFVSSAGELAEEARVLAYLVRCCLNGFMVADRFDSGAIASQWFGSRRRCRTDRLQASGSCPARLQRSQVWQGHNLSGRLFGGVRFVLLPCSSFAPRGFSAGDASSEGWQRRGSSSLSAYVAGGRRLDRRTGWRGRDYAGVLRCRIRLACRRLLRRSWSRGRCIRQPCQPLRSAAERFSSSVGCCPAESGSSCFDAR